MTVQWLTLLHWPIESLCTETLFLVSRFFVAMPSTCIPLLWPSGSLSLRPLPRSLYAPSPILISCALWSMINTGNKHRNAKYINTVQAACTFFPINVYMNAICFSRFPEKWTTYVVSHTMATSLSECTSSYFFVPFQRPPRRLQLPQYIAAKTPAEAAPPWLSWPGICSFRRHIFCTSVYGGFLKWGKTPKSCIFTGFSSQYYPAIGVPPFYGNSHIGRGSKNGRPCFWSGSPDGCYSDING